MTETRSFIFPLDQFTAAGKALLLYAQHHPAEFAILSLLIVAGVVTIVVPLAIGFGAAGPVAGTVAAAWQASIGNVVAGSLFATLQSMTMTGTLVAVGGGLIVVGAAGLAGAAEWARGVDWAKSVDWTKGRNWATWAHVAGLDGGVMEQWGRSVDWAARQGWNGVQGAGKEGWNTIEDVFRSGAGRNSRPAFTWW